MKTSIATSAFAACLLAAAPAGAAVRVSVSESAIVMIGTAARDVLSVEAATGPFNVESTNGRIVAGAGCTSSDAQHVSCSGGVRPILRISARLLGGNDRLILDRSVFTRNVLRGGKGRDVIRGGAERDNIYGEGGGDRLFGAAGDDKLFGGDGSDYLKGGAGVDVLRGGPGGPGGRGNVLIQG